MEIRPIRTDGDHRVALAEIDAHWGATEGTDEGDRLDVLLALVEIYEARRWPIEADESFDPVDVLKYAIDELGHRRTSGITFTRFGNSLTATSAHRRYDPQDQRGMENSG